MTEHGFIARKHIESMSPYVGGKHIDAVAREYGLAPEKIIKLASNESPYGMSPKAREAMAKAALTHERYPDGNVYYCREAIAKAWNLTPDWVLTGNGTDEVLYVIARALIEANTSTVICQHAFSVYRLSTLENMGQPITVPAKDYAIDLDAMAEAIRPDTRIVYLTNPNNPTGLAFSKEDLVRFIEKVPERCVILLDEAYADYMTPAKQYDSIALLRRYPNLVITRTFSKAYGMAGLRAGYALAHPDFIELLNRIRPFFGMNGIAQAAARVAIEDQAFIKEVCEKNAKERDRVSAFFQANSIRYLPSEANFILFEVKHVLDVLDGLLRRGIIARNAANFNLPGWIRISIGLPHENDAFIKALEETLVEIKGKY